MAARLPFLAASRCHATRRSYATAPASSSGSNLPLIAGALALAAAGTAYYMSTTGKTPSLPDPRDLKDLEAKAKTYIQGKAPTESAAPKVTGALNPNEFINFKLAKVEPYNHNTSKFVFELPDGQDSGLTVASCVVTKAADDSLVDDKGKPIIRPYTPTTAPNEKGFMEFIIKKYEQGKMSKHFFELKVGDKLGIKGPIKKFDWVPNQFDRVAFIVGGSGVTPAWQVLQAIDANSEDKTKATLIFSNVTEADILLRKEFEDLQRRKPDQFKMVFTLDKPPKAWSGPTGFITADILGKNLPPAGLADKIKVFVCGPPGQVAAVAGAKDGMKQGELKGLLADLGYTEKQVFKF